MRARFFKVTVETKFFPPNVKLTLTSTIARNKAHGNLGMLQSETSCQVYLFLTTSQPISNTKVGHSVRFLFLVHVRLNKRFSQDLWRTHVTLKG